MFPTTIHEFAAIFIHDADFFVPIVGAVAVAPADEIVVVVPTDVAVKSIPDKPMIIQTKVPAKPIYKGTFMRFPISLSTCSRCLSQVSFKIPKSADAPLFLHK